MKCPLCSGNAYIERRYGGKPFEVNCNKCNQWFKQKIILIPFNPANEFEDDIPFDIGLREPLLRFALAMENKMSEKDSEYGDSWKSMSIIELEQRMEQEIEEYKEQAKYRGEGTASSLAGETVDIANICMMLWNRLQGDEHQV